MATYNQVSYGSQGSDVKKLQELLNKNGAKLTVDGIFGNQTKQAVMDYQKANSLAVDGIVGNNTWGALTKVTAPAASTGSSGGASAAAPTWSYDDFKVSESTAAADQKRQEVAGQRPGDFSYGAYEKSDAVLQAEALLQQQLANRPGAYQSQWQSQLDDILGRIMNREKFSYDLNEDALYQQLKDQYVMQGQQAMMDTMGQAQAMTGGYGNSYAQSVGQQTYQGYLQQLNDRVPELYGMALDQYNLEGQALYDQAALMAQREDQDYGRYRDQISDYYAELDRLTDDARYQGEQDYGRYMDAFNMAYGQHRDQVADWQQEQARADEDYWRQYERDYGQYADNRNLSYEQYWNDKSFAYQQDRDKVKDEQWQAEFDEAKRQYDQQYALAAGKTSGNGSPGDYTPTGNPDYDGNGIPDTAPEDTDPSDNITYTQNGSLTKGKVQTLQRILGVTDDGIFGPETQKAAGGRSADEAYNYFVLGKGNPGGKPNPAELSQNGKNFMKNLPYAHAGSDPNAWKNVVDERLKRAYENGVLSETDVMLILKQLGIE